MPRGSIVNKRKYSDLSEACPEIVLEGQRNVLTGEGLLDIQIQLGNGILTFADIRNLKASVLLQKLQSLLRFACMVEGGNIIISQFSCLLFFLVEGLVPADDLLPGLAVGKEFQSVLEIGKVLVLQFEALADPLHGLRIMAGKHRCRSQSVSSPGTLL